MKPIITALLTVLFLGAACVKSPPVSPPAAPAQPPSPAAQSPSPADSIPAPQPSPAAESYAPAAMMDDNLDAALQELDAVE